MYYTAKKKDTISEVRTRNNVDESGHYLSHDLSHYLQEGITKSTEITNKIY
jgi:hypothetical protein